MRNVLAALATRPQVQIIAVTGIGAGDGAGHGGFGYDRIFTPLMLNQIYLDKTWQEAQPGASAARFTIVRHGFLTDDATATPYRVVSNMDGVRISNGTIVDATIIGAPSLTKDKKGERDPEMNQTAKGKQWYFGMKAHVGVDSRTKLIHTILASAAIVADVDALPLLHGKETRVGRPGVQAPYRCDSQGCTASSRLH